MEVIHIYDPGWNMDGEEWEDDVSTEMEDIPDWRRKLAGYDQSMPLVYGAVEHWCIARALDDAEDESEVWLLALETHPELSTLMELTNTAKLMRGYVTSNGIRFKRDFAMEAARARYFFHDS